LQIAPVVDAAQFLGAVIIGFARQMLKRIAEEVYVAALPCGFRQNLPNSPAQAGMIIADQKLGTFRERVVGYPAAPSNSKCFPDWLAHRHYVAPAFAINADRTSTAWLRTAPSSRTFS